MKKFLFGLLCILLVSSACIFVSCASRGAGSGQSVEFYVDGEKYATVGTGGRFVLPAEPEKDGLMFEGWFISPLADSPLTRQEMLERAKRETEPLCVYARFAKFYTVTFYTGTEQTIPAQKVKAGGYVQEPEYLQPPSYDQNFVGWYTDYSRTERWDFTMPVTQDLTLRAKWRGDDEWDEVRVTFNYNMEGVPNKTVLAVRGYYVYEEPDFAPPFCRFDYWSLNPNGTDRWQQYADEDITVYANWMDWTGESKMVPIQFEGMDVGAVDARIGYPIEKEIKLDIIRIEGIYKDINLTQEWDMERDVVDLDTVLYISGEVITHTVTFLDEDGNELFPEQTVRHRDSFWLPHVEKEDCVHTKWDIYSKRRGRLIDTVRFYRGAYGQQYDCNEDLIVKAGLPRAYKFTQRDDGDYRVESEYDDLGERIILVQGKFTVPTEYNGKRVVEIASGAFGGFEINQLVIPSGIRSIGNYAFNSARFAGDVVIPLSVTEMGEGVFDSSYTSLIIKAEAESIPQGWNARWNSGLYPVVWDCNRAKTYYEDEILYSLKDGVASVIYCTKASLCPAITIPETVLYENVVYVVKRIEEGAFYRIAYPESISVPDTLEWVGSFAFSNYLSMYEENGAYYLGNAANPYVVLIKYVHEKETAFVLSAQTRVIYDSALWIECGRLEFEEGSQLKGIGCQGIYLNDGVADITLPQGIIHMDVNAVAGASDVSVYVSESERPSGWDEKCFYGVQVVWGAASANEREMQAQSCVEYAAGAVAFSKKRLFDVA